MAPLTRDQEIALAKRIKRGDKAARDEFIMANIPLVVHVAKRFPCQGMEFEDLVQEGMIGLIKAVKKFNYRKGNKFSTFATLWIQQTIGRAIENQSRLIRLPVHITTEVRQIVRAIEALKKELGRSPFLSEVSDRTGFKPEKVIRLLTASKVPLSLDDQAEGRLDYGSYPGKALDSRDDLSDRLNNLDMAKQLNALLGKLKRRERQVIKRRFGIGTGCCHSFGKISKDYGVCGERIRQIEKKALKKLRQLGEENTLEEYA